VPVSEHLDLPERTRWFDLERSQVRSARQFVATTLVDWGLDAMVADAELAVSELVGNAVLHSNGASGVEVRILAGPRTVRVLVCDDGEVPREPVVEEHPDPVDPTGRGLAVVGVLASAWGIDRSGTGTTVWFELDRPEP
jgi:anti-sigma regulatory factor (Ser/Thr protein kinase)